MFIAYNFGSIDTETIFELMHCCIRDSNSLAIGSSIVSSWSGFCCKVQAIYTVMLSTRKIFCQEDL